MIRPKDASSDDLTNTVLAPLSETITTLFDHHNYVVTETNRMADLYQFWGAPKYEEKSPKPSPVQQEDQSPSIPNVKQYIKNKPHLSQTSDENLTSLVAPCVNVGLNAKLNNILLQARKMDNYLIDPVAQAQTSRYFTEVKDQTDVVISRVEGICELIEKRKQHRKAGQKNRIDAVRASKTDAHQRLQTAIAKLDEFHTQNMRQLDETLNSPLEVPEVRVHLSSPKE